MTSMSEPSTATAIFVLRLDGTSQYLAEGNLTNDKERARRFTNADEAGLAAVAAVQRNPQWLLSLEIVGAE